NRRTKGLAHFPASSKGYPLADSAVPLNHGRTHPYSDHRHTRSTPYSGGRCKTCSGGVPPRGSQARTTGVADHPWQGDRRAAGDRAVGLGTGGGGGVVWGCSRRQRLGSDGREPYSTVRTPE